MSGGCETRRHGMSERWRQTKRRRPVRVAAAGLLALAAAALGVIGLAGTPNAGAQTLPPTQLPPSHGLMPPLTVGPTMTCYSAPNPVVEVGQMMSDPCLAGPEGMVYPAVTITSTTPRVCSTRTTTQSGEIYIEFDAPGSCAWTISWHADAISQSTTVVTPNPVPPSPVFHTFTRIAGQTQLQTAIEELYHEFPTGSLSCPASRTVLLATDATFPDALSGAYLAGRLRTGLLLTAPGSLSSTVETALRSEGIGKVIVLGGPDAVSATVVSTLESLPAYSCSGTQTADTLAVTRIAGQTQYATAEKIAESLPSQTVGSLAFPGAYAHAGAYNDTTGGESGSGSATGEKTAIVASGVTFQDAMSASAIAYASHVPILLTAPDALSTQAKAAISSLGITQVIVAGGEYVVSTAVVSTLEQLGVSVLRVAGQTYSDTSAKLAAFETATTGLGWAGTGSVVVARGDYYTDGLAGSDVTGILKEPLLLVTNPSSAGAPATSFLSVAGTTGIGGARVAHLVVLGGIEAVTPTLVNILGNSL